MFLLYSTFTEMPWSKQLSIARTLIRKHVHTMAWYWMMDPDATSPRSISHQPNLALAAWNAVDNEESFRQLRNASQALCVTETKPLFFILHSYMFDKIPSQE